MAEAHSQGVVTFWSAARSLLAGTGRAAQATERRCGIGTGPAGTLIAAGDDMVIMGTLDQPNAAGAQTR
jgi:hypothetical protein